MKRKLSKGNPIEELVKGSLEYTMGLINSAFRKQFPTPYSDALPHYYICDSFADHVIVSGWGTGFGLNPDEYYRVTYQKNGDEFVFAPFSEWEVVELTYQPKTIEKPVTEKKKKKGTKFVERISAKVGLQESEEGKPRKIHVAEAMTADLVNGNGRRYSATVLEAAVKELKGHLHESAGQGRAVQTLGEAEHPSDKGGRPNLLETVTKWDEVSFDGRHVSLTGSILPTSKGKDILAIMEGGVEPGVSLRGYGEGKNIKLDGQQIFEVTELHITGFDLVMEPSFENSVSLVESIQPGEFDMNELLEQLKKLLAEQPDLFKGITEAQLNEMNEKALKKVEKDVREAMGIGPDVNITESLKKMADNSRKFEEGQKQAAVKTAIAEGTKDLPYGKEGNQIFIEAVTDANLTEADAVKPFIESMRKQFDKIYSKHKLRSMGLNGGKTGIEVIGDVLETETDTPAFARVAFELTESVRKHENRSKRAMVERAESPAQVFTEKYLERFDKLYQRQLMEEARAIEEAETTTDLNLPYSVSRAVIAEAFPNLVAANIFDVGLMDQSPMKIFYEAFSGETGYTVAVTDEVEVAGTEGTWYDLANKNLVPGTVVVTSNPAGTTYVEGTDFVIDYELGKIMPIAAGAIDANDVLVDYSYHATRKGENTEIERGKVTLASQTIEAIAYRLADQITHEAIVFSRSQIGWDAVGRTIANLIRQVRRDIDRGLIEKAVAAALSVASNSGGTWTAATDPWALLAEYLGYAKVKVANRFYTPTSFLLSKTNSDYLSNWDGFTTSGFPNALLNAAGFVGAVKGLPVFDSTEMRDTWGLALNREVVIHRVFQAMTVKGPFPSYSNGKLVAAEQYYAEEYNASLAPIAGKAAYVKFA